MIPPIESTKSDIFKISVQHFESVYACCEFAKRSVLEKLSLNVDIIEYKISCKSYNNLRLKGKEKNINEKICQTVCTD